MKPGQDIIGAPHDEVLYSLGSASSSYTAVCIENYATWSFALGVICTSVLGGVHAVVLGATRTAAREARRS